MRLNFLSAVLLALPLPVAALVHGRARIGCHATDAPCVTTENSDGSECCQQETKADVPKQTSKTNDQADRPRPPDRVQSGGAHLPRREGHRLRPHAAGVLASLDKLDGVEASSANYAGTMIRISVTTATDRDKVAEGVRKVLTEEDRKAVRLAGDEIKSAVGPGGVAWGGADRGAFGHRVPHAGPSSFQDIRQG